MGAKNKFSKNYLLNFKNQSESDEDEISISLKTEQPVHVVLVRLNIV